MNGSLNNTEDRILSAAREIFISKGFDAVRMDEIALLAGVDKAALHYYFRSKEKLFDKVLDVVLPTFGANLSKILCQELSSPDNIRDFASRYIDFASGEPQVDIVYNN